MFEVTLAATAILVTSRTIIIMATGMENRPRTGPRFCNTYTLLDLDMSRIGIEFGSQSRGRAPGLLGIQNIRSGRKKKDPASSGSRRTQAAENPSSPHSS